MYTSKSIRLVNLLGFPVSVAGVHIPSDGWYVASTAVVSTYWQHIPTQHGDIPVHIVPNLNLVNTCLQKVGEHPKPFPEPQEGVVYLVIKDFHKAALADGRNDVWGLGEEAPERGFYHNLVY